MFNYGEYIFQQIITTDFVQRKLVQILISLAANIINLHIVSLLCAIVSVNVYINFFLQIGISVAVALKIDIIYNFMERYNAEFYTLTQYLINNYSINNYLYWKRIVVVTSCVYACMILLLVKVTNWTLFGYIIQYVLSFLIIEQCEEQRIQKWIKEYQSRPHTKRFTENLVLINSYMPPTKHILRSKHFKNFSGAVCEAIPEFRSQNCRQDICGVSHSSDKEAWSVRQGIVRSAQISQSVRQRKTRPGARSRYLSISEKGDTRTRLYDTPPNC